MCVIPTNQPYGGGTISYGTTNECATCGRCTSCCTCRKCPGCKRKLGTSWPQPWVGPRSTWLGTTGGGTNS